ncbi:MAG TPA: hypothetical protein VKS81_01695 [Bacteroidota bacterium]|nr:hypothetical protein [Bacteroidota bacterium]
MLRDLFKKLEIGKAPPNPNILQRTNQDELIGLHLRKAEFFIRTGEIERAKTEIERIFVLDNQNPHAKHYREKIGSIATSKTPEETTG